MSSYLSRFEPYFQFDFKMLDAAQGEVSKYLLLSKTVEFNKVA